MSYKTFNAGLQSQKVGVVYFCYCVFKLFHIVGLFKEFLDSFSIGLYHWFYNLKNMSMSKLDYNIPATSRIFSLNTQQVYNLCFLPPHLFIVTIVYKHSGQSLNSVIETCSHTHLL